MEEHRNLNNFHKYALLIGVFLLAALIGSMWLGWNLTLWILGIGALLSLYSISYSPTRILRWQGATKLDPYHNSNLYTIVNQLASRAGLVSSPEVYYVNSRIPNAFALGTKDKPVVGITSGLVSILNERELQGVLAHEISHIKNNDLFVKGMAMSFGNLTNTLSTIGKFLLIFVIPMMLFGIQSFSFGLILMMIFSPALNVLLQLGLSRSMEYVADYDAAQLTKDPLGLASALHRIESSSIPWWRKFNQMTFQSSDWLKSHPNTTTRIEKLKAMSRNFPSFRQPEPDFHKMMTSYFTQRSFY